MTASVDRLRQELAAVRKELEYSEAEKAEIKKSADEYRISSHGMHAEVAAHRGRYELAEKKLDDARAAIAGLHHELELQRKLLDDEKAVHLTVSCVCESVVSMSV